MIEGRDGLAAAEQIAAVPNLDGIFVGPMDLSHSLGVPGEMAHPDVVAAIRMAIAACRKAGITAGIFAGTPEAAKRWMGEGVSFLGVGADTAYLRAALVRAVARHARLGARGGAAVQVAQSGFERGLGSFDGQVRCDGVDRQVGDRRGRGAEFGAPFGQLC